MSISNKDMERVIEDKKQKEKTVAFYTLGCKVNQYETEIIKKDFLDNNYKEVNFEEKADVYVVNTCTVTNVADRKNRKMLRRAKNNNPDSVVVSGLAADLDTITGVYLQKKYKRNVTTSYSGEVRITDTPKLHYDTDKVTFSLQMVHVTEQEIKAKVQLIHQPFSVEVKLFPEEVPLLLTGDVETIRNLKPTDITIVADYNQRKDRYIPLEVRKKPTSLNVNFTEQKEVEYLIIHE